ncbi:TetR/AcrR family transcriptional regulator [Actinocorallia sp. API 0066]|uniref:TetR/AcrR family transcriptional regulator n=1 Tax=Actinocorallia sp. API 0066 TaxID=2896846 RepID=UPI001E432E95|nr:helix-turn-helix domain-containing protein [Actinocorallia sp. API 0066]MCD0452767.1 TetR/AcrR family transcriptional regulator [Actinocorallia sp. API 0066]
MEARRAILEAARRCFLRDGCHATSLRDVTSEADVPFPAVAAHFTGMDELVEAFAQDAAGEVAAVFAAAFGPLPRPVAVFPHVEDGFALLALRVWSATLRASVLDERVDAAYTMFTRALLWYVELYQRGGMITREVDAPSVVRLLVALIHVFMVQRTLFGEVDTRLFHDGLRALALTPEAPSSRPGP